MKRYSLFILMIVLASLCLSVFVVGNAAEAKKVVTYADGLPMTLTPGLMEGPGCLEISQIYDWLVRVKPDSVDLQPELALSWESSPDAKIWTVKLREGVKYHDGTEFNADDVIFTVERSQDPEIGHLMQTNLAIIERMEKLDDYTVRFYLKMPNAKFMLIFAEYNMAILSHTYDYAKYGDLKPMGTGAFMVKEIVPTESVVLVKNPNYWMKGIPKYDEIQFVFIPDASTRCIMVESGEADIARYISATEAIRVRQNPNLNLLNQKLCGQNVVGMRVDIPPFNDNRVRLALKYCIDNEKMAQLLHSEELGVLVEVTESPITSLFTDYPSLPARGLNIEKAKQLLAEAGYPNGLDIDLYYSTNWPNTAEIAVTLKEMAEPAGIRINLNGFLRDIYLDKYWMNVEFGVTDWDTPIDPVILFRTTYITGAPWNETHLSNPAIDALVDKISSEADPEKMKELCGELQKIFYEEGSVIMVTGAKYFVTSKRVEGYIPAVTSLDDMRFIDIKD
ncbi:MAG: ABC transporter substrate-binding protein [Atribacterota bacterium]|nr:ABC transporter substrate-binding protein [Atribacterota bacterium]